MLGWTGLPEIPEPVWPRPAADAHWTSRLLAPLRSGHYWSYLLHQLIINPVVSTVTFSLTVTWWATALGGLTYWFWQGFLPDPDVDPWAEWLRSQVPLLQRPERKRSRGRRLPGRRASCSASPCPG